MLPERLTRVSPALFRPIAATLVVALIWLGYVAWSSWSGAHKLEAAGIGAAAGRINVEIVLAFPPESFHLTRIQDIGRLTGVRGRSVFLKDVTSADLRALARNYWVREIHRAPGSGAG
jgi:hypothetical protein